MLELVCVFELSQGQDVCGLICHEAGTFGANYHQKCFVEIMLAASKKIAQIPFPCLITCHNSCSKNICRPRASETTNNGLMGTGFSELKGTVQRDFLTPVFFTKWFILVSIDMPKSDFEIFRIFGELFELKLSKSRLPAVNYSEESKTEP
jgi:hypothetical protein